MQSQRQTACLAAIAGLVSCLLVGRKNSDNVSPQIIPESRNDRSPFPGNLGPQARDPRPGISHPHCVRECNPSAPRRIPLHKCGRSGERGGGFWGGCTGGKEEEAGVLVVAPQTWERIHGG